jgi:methylenetetrahydrofolate--tRNA-(uracil-5-)-methyltransferase
VDWPGETAHGALAGYISNPAVTDFQPMNINFGLFPALETVVRGKRERYRALADRALGLIENIKAEAERDVEDVK